MREDDLSMSMALSEPKVPCEGSMFVSCCFSYRLKSAMYASSNCAYSCESAGLTAGSYVVYYVSMSDCARRALASLFATVFRLNTSSSIRCSVMSDSTTFYTCSSDSRLLREDIRREVQPAGVLVGFGKLWFESRGHSCENSGLSGP